MKLSFLLKFAAVAAGLFLAAYIAAVANYTLPAYEVGVPQRPDPYGQFQYRGASHVHTRYSPDADATVSDVVVAARNNELDFLIVTDHNVLTAKKEEGYKDGLVFLAGSEISTDHGHFLSLGIGEELPDGDRRGSSYFAAAARLGGFNVVAHPFAGRSRFEKLYAGGFDGIEVINLKETLEEAAQFPFISLALALIAYPVSPRYAKLELYRRPAEALAFLDQALAHAPLTIMCGADYHGFPDGTIVLAQCANHVLAPERMNGRFDHDSQLVMDAIRGRRVFVALDGIARADGFSYACAAAPGGKGREVRISLRSFPHPDLVSATLYWNGQKIGSKDGLREEWKAPIPGAGPVRIEVELQIPTLLKLSRKVSWIHAVACQD